MTDAVTLSLVAFTVFGVIPFVLALTADRWYWRIPLFGDLVDKQAIWDDERAVPTVADELMGAYRKRNDVGAKITVSHHLADVANDIKVQLMHAQMRAFGVTLVGFVLVFFVETNYSIQRANHLESSELGSASSAGESTTETAAVVNAPVTIPPTDTHTTGTRATPSAVPKGGSAAGPRPAAAPSVTPELHRRKQQAAPNPLDGFLRVLAAYLLPVAAGASIFEAMALLLAMYNQARKYEGLLDPARIERRRQRVARARGSALSKGPAKAQGGGS